MLDYQWMWMWPGCNFECRSINKCSATSAKPSTLGGHQKFLPTKVAHQIGGVRAVERNLRNGPLFMSTSPLRTAVWISLLLFFYDKKQWRRKHLEDCRGSASWLHKRLQRNAGRDTTNVLARDQPIFCKLHFPNKLFLQSKIFLNITLYKNYYFLFQHLHFMRPFCFISDQNHVGCAFWLLRLAPSSFSNH